MKFIQLRNYSPVLCLALLASCGGGGGGSSSSAPAQNPTAIVNNDSASTIVNTSVDINVLSNDSNVDASTLQVLQQPNNGVAELINGAIRYSPNPSFVGTDQLTYQIQGHSDSTLQGNVSVTVASITNTRIESSTIAIPSSGYTIQNNAELSANVLTSPELSFSIDPNAVSFSVSLIGSDVGSTTGNLFIAELNSPDGLSLYPLNRQVTFCDLDFCSALIPRRPAQVASEGTWTVRLGTLDSSLSTINLTNMALTVAQRIGPAPAGQTTLQVRPFLTATSITENDLTPILDQLSTMAAASNITLEFDAIQSLSDSRFTEVSRNFSDPTTSELVQQGEPDRVNLFFLEDFSGSGGSGLLGISGGLPGPFGQSNQFNGVLINATANLGETAEVYARNTAEIALHEMGHFLGLYHTTERQFNLHDVLDDTPNCLVESDSVSSGIGGVADVEECRDGQNLMFWNSDFSGAKTPLSSDQQEIIQRSPIARQGA